MIRLNRHRPARWAAIVVSCTDVRALTEGVADQASEADRVFSAYQPSDIDTAVFVRKTAGG